jgi:hypothetical protein
MPRLPLPAGITRHRLVPELYRPLVRRVLVRRAVVTAGLYALTIVLLGALGLDLSEVAWVVFGAVWAGGMFLAWARARTQVQQQLAMFEVLVSSRVARRVMPILPVAEVLRPEVTRVVETARGIWLVSEQPRRTVFLVSALEGYAELRAAIATWGQMESLRGLAAFGFVFAQSRHMRPRDMLGGALATDPTLLGGLQTVRVLSADQGNGYPGTIVAGRRRVRLLLMWVLCIVMFLALWQFLQPVTPNPRPRPMPTPPAVAP